MTEDIFETPSSTPNFQTELAEKLADLVPEVVADGKIDVLKLQELLSQDAAETSERFGLFWPGKQGAMRLAQMPTTATLRPQLDKSKSWETTENVFIEGDNLEVLKLLQKHYHAKIKMIFIDPPYNTGKEFVYPDDYSDGLVNYLNWTSQVDSEGRKISSNSELQGRFHSNWLNMMYPRLKLARNLLRDDGSIFVSIDDNEVAHLRKLLDEIFGESNFVANAIWQSRTSISDDHEISRNHNHILVYAKNKSLLKFGGIPLDEADYKNPDNDPRGPWKLVPLDANKPGGDTMYEVFNPETGEGYFPPSGRSWAINSSEMKKLLDDGRILFGLGGNSAPKKKLYLQERLAKGDRKTPSSILADCGTTKDGTAEVESIFDAKGIFDYPKPTKLLRRLLSFGLAEDKDALVLDFFAGSATTAHAVMLENSLDGGSRKFICVQLPEPTPTDSEALKAGYKDLAAVSRARIQLAAEVIEFNLANQLSGIAGDLDLGFRSFRLDSSVFTKWRIDSDVDREVLEQQLRGLRDSANDDATQDDLLFEVLCKQGYSLTERTATLEIGGLRIQSVGDGVVLAYLNEHSKPTLDSLRQVIERGPAKFIILEDAFLGDDELKTNLVQLCKSKNIELWTA